MSRSNAGPTSPSELYVGSGMAALEGAVAMGGCAGGDGSGDDTRGGGCGDGGRG
jgi:hypothetical protein